MMSWCHWGNGVGLHAREIIGTFNLCTYHPRLAKLPPHHHPPRKALVDELLEHSFSAAAVSLFSEISKRAHTLCHGDKGWDRIFLCRIAHGILNQPSEQGLAGMNDCTLIQKKSLILQFATENTVAELCFHLLSTIRKSIAFSRRFY